MQKAFVLINSAVVGGGSGGRFLSVALLNRTPNTLEGGSDAPAGAAAHDGTVAASLTRLDLG